MLNVIILLLKKRFFDSFKSVCYHIGDTIWMIKELLYKLDTKFIN